MACFDADFAAAGKFRRLPEDVHDLLQRGVDKIVFAGAREMSSVGRWRHVEFDGGARIARQLDVVLFAVEFVSDVVATHAIF